MREEHKLYKAIKQDGVDTQSDILDELKRRYPQYVELSEQKQAPARKRKFAFIYAIAAVAVCAAVIVPCAVLLPNKNSGANNGGGKDNSRYCTQEDYEKNDAEYTILEYRESNNRNFLYFDWYEYGEDLSTVCYISVADSEVLCLEEQAYIPQTNELVRLSITKSNVYLDVFDVIIVNSKNEQTVDNHVVKWEISTSTATCVFENDGYRYFIRIDQGQDENRLFALVAELLGTK